jgi:hypothetical protein
MKHPIAKLKVIAKQERMTMPSQDSFLSDNEWATVIVLIEALAPFQGAKSDLSSKRYPALGSTFVISRKISSHCVKLSNQSLQLHIKSLIQMLQAKVTIRLNALSKHNQYLANLSMIVDLQLKLKYIKSITDKKKIKSGLITHLSKYYRDPPALPILPSLKQKRAAEQSITDMLCDNEDNNRVDESVDKDVTCWLAYSRESLSIDIFK